jgi:hypothetical protein
MRASGGLETSACQEILWGGSDGVLRTWKSWSVVWRQSTGLENRGETIVELFGVRSPFLEQGGGL